METWENEADFLKYIELITDQALSKSDLPHDIVETTIHMWGTVAKLVKVKTGKSAKSTNDPFGITKELGVPRDNS